MKGELLSSQEAADLLGVGLSSIKRWADEGLLPCVKTLGKHRRFTRRDVEQLRQVQAGKAPSEPNLPPGQARSFIEVLLRSHTPQEVEARLLLTRSELGCWWMVAEQLGGILVELGALWQSGNLSIIEEHIASERLARSVARVSEWLPVSPDAPRALLATAEGDDHTLGLTLVELCLRELGWLTVWSGRRTPISELVRGITSPRHAVRLLAMSASQTSDDARGLAKQAEALGSACQKAGVALVLGGSGRWPENPRHGVRLRSFGEFCTLVRGLAS